MAGNCVYIFSVFNNSFEAKEFFNYISIRHPNIKFTMETEVNKIIPFLDVLIDNSQNIFKNFDLSYIYIFWFPS